MTAETTGSAGLADRYAAALFELADEAKALDAVAGELTLLDRMVTESADLRRLIRSPVISRADQRRGMEAVLDHAGVGDLTRRFVGLIARNRRLFALPDMVAAFRDMLAGRRGETAAVVVSAKPLSAAQSKAVGEALKKAVGTDVAVDERVDPSLLGGMIVRVGSRMIDSSLSTKLQRLRLAMKGVG